MSSVIRNPSEESIDLYPGLVVQDNRVGGSITIGRSRLSVSAIIYAAILEGWKEVESGWSPEQNYGFSAQDLSDFLVNLLEVRGEFARLLLVLADCEREASQIDPMDDEAVPYWWIDGGRRRIVIEQLKRCLTALET